MNFNLIGAGKLGKNIALALESAQIASLKAICNLHFDSAEQACREIAAGFPVHSIKELPLAEILLISCNDDSIHSVISTLTNDTLLKPGSFVIHCSGVLNSTVLKCF
jgi:predicted short-subunit dehydrogenase-like oxidoreductase (DUF2520 family)